MTDEEKPPVAAKPFEVARWAVRRTELVPYGLTLHCQDCEKQMAQIGVGNYPDGKTALFYECPTCKKRADSPEVFPRIEHAPKPMIQVPTSNFVNPNKGPRGRN